MLDDGTEPIDRLSDGQLLDRESTDRSEFLRLDQMEPTSSGTTYRAVRVSRALLAAWSRWTQSGVAARLRGLHPRRGDRH